MPYHLGTEHRDWLYCSEERKGLFLLSILGIGTGSLARLSPKGASLTAAHEARIRGTPAGSWRAGMAEQYELQIEKLRANTASMELISMPTFVSRPSTLTPTNSPLWILGLIDSKDPPKLGKKYFTLVAVLNHPWSRGTIVRAPLCHFWMIQLWRRAACNFSRPTRPTCLRPTLLRRRIRSVFGWAAQCG